MACQNDLKPLAQKNAEKEVSSDLKCAHETHIRVDLENAEERKMYVLVLLARNDNVGNTIKQIEFFRIYWMGNR
jgi:hypothetical protein